MVKRPANIGECTVNESQESKGQTKARDHSASANPVGCLPAIPELVFGALGFTGAIVLAFVIGWATNMESPLALAPLVIGLLIVLAPAFLNFRFGFLAGYIVAPFIIFGCGFVMLALYCGMYGSPQMH